METQRERKREKEGGRHTEDPQDTHQPKLSKNETTQETKHNTMKSHSTQMTTNAASCVNATDELWNSVCDGKALRLVLVSSDPKHCAPPRNARCCPIGLTSV
eukprot:scaffold2618_cov240-Pinguiococcus_pyrenoidosus.AAC.5